MNRKLDKKLSDDELLYYAYKEIIKLTIIKAMLNRKIELLEKKGDRIDG